MRRRSNMTVFFWGFAISTSLGIVGAIGSGVELPTLAFGESAESGPGVMVMIVGDAGRVARMREVIGADRLLVDTLGGFAVSGGRVIAVDHGATGPILMQAGWDDAPLDIYLPGSLRQNTSPGHRAQGGTSSRVRELMNKPELSLLESRELLGWMDQNF